MNVLRTWSNRVAVAAMLALTQFQLAFAGESDCYGLSGVFDCGNLFTSNNDIDFARIVSKVRQLAILFFALGTIYFFVMVWRNGLKLANSGDNPQARAAAQSALWMNALGGMVFFGAAIFVGLIQYFIGVNQGQ